VYRTRWLAEIVTGFVRSWSIWPFAVGWLVLEALAGSSVFAASPGDERISVLQLGDFNGDGKDDVLLRHKDGRWRYFPMDGRDLLAGGGVVDLPQDREWRLVGIGDFGGDGKDDVLLRHEDGRWRYEPMDGRSLLPGGSELNLTRNVDWRVAGIGDLNGDGRDDVLIRHRNGRWHYYALNGRRRVGGSGAVELPRSLNWQMAGLGDLNGDGHDDVLLRHENGSWRYYPMNGRIPRPGQGDIDLKTSLDWRLAGLGDLNGDGNDDVLLRHVDGDWRYYPMNGRSLARGGGSINMTRNPDWQVAGIGDLNGDGRDDVLIRHKNGRWHYYPLNGRRRLSGGGTADLPASSNWLLAWEAHQPAEGSIGGRLNVTEGQVLDGDTNDPQDLRVANDSPDSAQRVPLPASVAGFADLESDEWDIYRVHFPAPMRISLAIAEPEAGDLDLYLVNNSLEIVGESAGLGDLEVIQTRRTGEHLVAVEAYEGGSNYSLVMSLAESASGAAASATASSDGDFVVGELIVKPKEGVGSAARMEALANHPRLVEKAKAPSGATLMRVQPPSGLRIMSKSLNQTGFRYATEELRAKAETLRLFKRLRRDPAFEYVQPNYIYQAMAVPNDPYYSRQWHYPHIALPQAWDVTKGDDGIVIAVIDSGVETDHPDLASRLLRDGRGRVVGYDFISDPSRARDGDGIDPDPHDVGDLDYITRSSFHGTHVAGTVGAATNNGVGVAGVTWRGKIMPIRVLGRDGGTTLDIAEGIRYAAGLPNASGEVPTERADVMNLSLGRSNEQCRRLPSVDQATRDALDAAIDAGVVVVVAAGNDNCHQPTPMTTVDGVISVSATDFTGRAPYSNYGATIDVAAPGGNVGVDGNGDGYVDGVLSAMADDSSSSVSHTYTFAPGTSMAAPHVAGVVALMLAANPDLTPSDVNRLLAGTHADPAAGAITRDRGAPGRDDEFGHGLIDANQAVRVARAIRGGNDNPPDRPVLAVSPTRLNFGAAADALRVQLSNVGSGELEVRSVRSDAPWLTASYEEWPMLVVRVDRSGLADGGYLDSLAIRSDGGDLTVPVIMQVQRQGVEADVGTVYALALDPDTYETLGQAVTNVRDGYAFRTPKLPGGTYVVAAGTDRDGDGYICDSGEACGIWPLLDSPGKVRVDGNQRVEFGVSIDLFARVASQSVRSRKLPQRGFAVRGPQRAAEGGR